MATKKELMEMQEPNGNAGCSQRARIARDPSLAQSRPSDESQQNFEAEQFGETEKEAKNG